MSSDSVVALAGAAYTGAGTIVTVASTRRFTASGLGAFASGWFTRGLVTFTSGAALNQKIEVKTHGVTGGLVIFDLWQPAVAPLLPGQTFTVSAGCDKTIDTCRAKFANAINFRGFPYMPGNDFLTKISRPGG